MPYSSLFRALVLALMMGMSTLSAALAQGAPTVLDPGPVVAAQPQPQPQALVVSGPVTVTGAVSIVMPTPVAEAPRPGASELTAAWGCGHPAVTCQPFAGYRVVVPGTTPVYVDNVADANAAAAEAIARLAPTARELDLSRRLREAEAARNQAQTRLDAVERAARGEPPRRQ
jgi:hypothetical protein